MKVNHSLSVNPAHIRWTHFACVLAGVFLATLIRFPIQPAIQDASPFFFYFPVVVAVAIFLGWRFGLLATALSVFPADYFWMVPYRTFSVDGGQALHIIGFSFAGLSVSWLSEAARKRKHLEEHLRAALANMGDAIITTDCRGRIVYLNTVARMLTEMHGSEGVGCAFGTVLDLFAESGAHSLNGTFQVALSSDDIESLPRRVIISSKSGKRYRVEQKTSRILDVKGEKLGMAILFHSLERDDEVSSAPVPAVPAVTVEPIVRNDDPPAVTSNLPRIAMVSIHGYVAAHPRLGDADTGGQVVYVLELSKKLAQLGYEVDIWTRQFESQAQMEPVSPQVRIIRMPCGGINFIPKEFLCEHLREWKDNALRFINEQGFKYEFINSHYWDGGLAADQLSRALSVPHIHTPHSLGIWKRRQSEASSAVEAARLDEEFNFTKRIGSERLLYVAADVIVATSPEQQGILVCDYNVQAEKCRMIPPGYDDTRFFPVSDATRDAIRKRLGFRTPVVQAIGRLADNKGYELLIKAFAVVAQRMPEATLHLAVGGKTLTPQETAIFVRLRTLTSELDLTRKVIFGSFIPDDQLADYYRAADVFVLSSRYEPFGMTAIEAMACGTPTVLTVHGGLYHAVTFGQHGLYADPCDPEDLGITILKALKDARVRSQLSTMGAEKARSLFTWSGVAQQFLSLIPGKKTK
ncbi:MAG TPA: glycosyltransferase [Candidatus Sulfotelmatobacter sp.]|nr:glycosyltransferase [Candidatus Sulfotelmatobacter sp.]